MGIPDYYEFLQISPNADHDTINRVYRFLAGRFHPDNPQTGDVDKFVLLKSAFDVLSDPRRRAEYNATRKVDAAPMSTSVNFMDGVEGEINRRGALLALLYLKRRTQPAAPEVSLSEVEERMGFPRDYLDFTTWYLKSKKYITKADNSDFTLTALGVDFVEANDAKLPILNILLNSGAPAETRTGMTAPVPVDRILGSPETTGAAAADPVNGLATLRGEKGVGPGSVPMPPNEEDRLEALRGYRILDTASEKVFDVITRLAVNICETPISLLTFIDRNRHWIKSNVGLSAGETSRDIAFCAHAILQDDLFIVPDAFVDDRFDQIPLVRHDPNVRFYAGAPLVTKAGHALGTLCVMDCVPRELTDDQKSELRALAQSVLLLLEVRRPAPISPLAV